MADREPAIERVAQVRAADGPEPEDEQAEY
jgi:hypothetical protein